MAVEAGINLVYTSPTTSMSERLRLINTAINHFVRKKYEKSVRAMRTSLENWLKLLLPLR